MSAARIKWIADCLHESIANLGYPVGMGLAPPRETLERAAAEIVRVDEKASEQLIAINAELLEASEYLIRQLCDGDEPDLDEDGDEIDPFAKLRAAVAKATQS